MSEVHVVFTAGDVDHLALRLSIAELRQEIRVAENHLAVARSYGEDQAERWWQDFIAISRLAIDVRRTRQRLGHRPRRKAGTLDVSQIKARNDTAEVIGQYTQLRRTGRRLLGSLTTASWCT